LRYVRRNIATSCLRASSARAPPHRFAILKRVAFCGARPASTRFRACGQYSGCARVGARREISEIGDAVGIVATFAQRGNRIAAAGTSETKGPPGGLRRSNDVELIWLPHNHAGGLGHQPYPPPPTSLAHVAFSALTGVYKIGTIGSFVFVLGELGHTSSQLGIGLVDRVRTHLCVCADWIAQPCFISAPLLS